jgi:hypothetical protein
VESSTTASLGASEANRRRRGTGRERQTVTTYESVPRSNKKMVLNLGSTTPQRVTCTSQSSVECGEAPKSFQVLITPIKQGEHH